MLSFKPRQSASKAHILNNYTYCLPMNPTAPLDKGRERETYICSKSLCNPDHANSPGWWGPVLSGNAMLLMEENVIIEHNYSVSYSVIIPMVFNIEHILKLNGMETPPKRNIQNC